MCLQEAHGLPTEILTELASTLPGWTVKHSSCLDSDGLDAGGLGGLLFLFAPRLLNSVMSNTPFDSGSST